MKSTLKKRAFVSAIAMLIVSAIVLTSSTFAWFSMSKEAKVESMDLTVSSPEGIQISANASAWTASLTVDEIFDNNPDVAKTRYSAYTGNNNLYPADLIPVSSAFAAADSATGYVNFFKAALNEAGDRATITAVTQTKDGQDGAGLIAFDLFFKVAESKVVKFDESTFSDGGSLAKTALRVAFTPLGNMPIGTPVDQLTAMNTFTAGNTNVIYEIDSLTRSDDAADPSKGNLSAGAKTTRGLTSTNNGSAPAADGIISATQCTAPVTGKQVTDQTVASTGTFTLNAGITKVRVYIWIEGNDVDCWNSISGDTIAASLIFKID